jgi:uncharacterized RDD family membrane protein YckC
VNNQKLPPKKGNESKGDDWNFKIDESVISTNVEYKNSIKKSTKNQIKKVLKIDEVSIDSNKTRKNMYEELESEKKLDEDIIEHASLIKRGIALGIDLIILFAVYHLAEFLISIDTFITNLIMNKYKFVWLVKPVALNNYFLIFNIIFLSFLGIIIPTLFYNASFGKMIAKIKVRGINQYTLSFEKVFLREIILKPISVLLILGFIIPFFNKERRSFHDLLLETIVVDE